MSQYKGKNLLCLKEVRVWVVWINHINKSSLAPTPWDTYRHKVNYCLKETDLCAGCVQVWIRSAELPGEHRYENRNNSNKETLHP